MIKNWISFIVFIPFVAGCGGGGNSGVGEANQTLIPPTATCQSTPSSFSQTPCRGAQMTVDVISSSSPNDVSATTKVIALDDLEVVNSGIFQGYEYVVGSRGNAHEIMSIVPFSGTLPAQTLEYEGKARVETANANGVEIAYRADMDATVTLDLTQVENSVEVLLFNAKQHTPLLGNATINDTGLERVTITGMSVDETTGQISSTPTANISQRNFIAVDQIKSYTNPNIAGGLAGENGKELGMVIGATNDGYITMQIVGRHQD